MQRKTDKGECCDLTDNFLLTLSAAHSGSQNELSNDKRISINGYQIYACLLEMLSPETAERLHENIRSPISQNIVKDKNSGKYIWEINSFDNELSEELSDILKVSRTFHAEKADTEFRIESVKRDYIGGFRDIRQRTSALMEQSRIKLDICTTAALKKSGEFLLFPDIELIIKNLWKRWNDVFPDNPFDDDDALALLLHGVYISAYDLSSSIYRMKGNDIRGFYGSITIGSRLSPPMKELLCALLYFSQYSGIGVKTALGMGKTKILLPK